MGVLPALSTFFVRTVTKFTNQLTCIRDSNINVTSMCSHFVAGAFVLHTYQDTKTTIGIKVHTYIHMNVLCMCMCYWYWFWFCECMKVTYLPCCLASISVNHLHMCVLQKCTFAMMAIPVMMFMWCNLCTQHSVGRGECEG